MSDKEKLSGVFAPVVTPFRNDEILYDDLRFNIRKLNESNLTGYLALGSNGEFRSLTDDEQIRVLEVFAEEKGSKVVMAGTGCESTQQTIEKSNRAAEMGFDFVSVLTPNYFANQMDGSVLREYYERIADSVSVPVLLCNAPGFTGGVKIPPKTVAELEKHPNIAGMKDSSPTGPARFMTVHDPDQNFHILAGSLNFFYPSLHLGVPGGIISLANVLPEPCCEIYRLFTEGRFDEARELHFRLARLNNAFSGVYGVPGVKAAMNSSGFKGGEPRHPLKPLAGESLNIIREKLSAEGF